MPELRKLDGLLLGAAGACSGADPAQRQEGSAQSSRRVVSPSTKNISGQGDIVQSVCACILSFACLAALSTSCKHKSSDDTGPDPVPVASVVATATPPVSAVPELIPPPVPPPAPAAPAPAKSADRLADTNAVKTCCAALHKEESSVPASEKGKYQSAAAGCENIAKLVAAGTTSRASALTSIRAATGGGRVPAACH